jgi:hypothetical protein
MAPASPPSVDFLVQLLAPAVELLLSHEDAGFV